MFYKRRVVMLVEVIILGEGDDMIKMKDEDDNDDF